MKLVKEMKSEKKIKEVEIELYLKVELKVDLID
jgi:hypothetical protein